MQHKFEKLAFL